MTQKKPWNPRGADNPALNRTAGMASKAMRTRHISGAGFNRVLSSQGFEICLWGKTHFRKVSSAEGKISLAEGKISLAQGKISLAESNY